MTSLTLLSRLLFVMIWLIVLLINAGPIIMDDTESYHIQSIKWIQEYGTIPGLVNLHERFGFNSSWFSSVSLFSFSNKLSGGITVLNGVLSAWLSYWLISNYQHLRMENSFHKAFAMLFTLIVSVLVWPLIRGNAATSNYDFITSCVVLILFTQILLSRDENYVTPVEWIIWPAFLFTVRVINFPILLLSFIGIIFLINQKNYRIIFSLATCCILLVVPFLIRNVIIAGFPFYPVSNFDWWNVDWKPDPRLTESILDYIKYFNRVNTTFLSLEDTKALGAAWIPSWFQHLFYYDKAIICIGLIGFLLSSLKIMTAKDDGSKQAKVIISISIVWLVCWFLIAPNPRFIYGVLLVGVFLFFYHVISFLKNTGKIKSILTLMMITMVVGSGYYLISKIWNQKEYRNWVLPVKLPEPPTTEFLIGGIVFRIPERINNNWNSRCYGTDLPCLYKIHPRLKPRGKNIRSGFHLEK